MGQPHIEDGRDTAQVIEHDPVCGGPIADEAAAPSLIHEGKQHWFCSESCRDLFIDEPERYLLREDLGEEVASARSDGEAGVLHDEPYR